MATKKAAKKRPGQPTKYREEYGQVMIDLASEGAGIAEVAAACGVSKETIYEWRRVHEEFSDAFARAKIVCQAWWEKQGREGLSNREMNHGLWKLNMVNRFPDDWKDKVDIEAKIQKYDVVIGGEDE